MTNTEFYRGAISASECVGNGWSIVTAKFGMYLGIGLVTILLISCIPFLNVILMGPVLGGFYYVVLRDMRGEPVDFGMMFKGFERFVPLMLGGLVQAVPGIVLQIVQYTVDIARLIAPGIRPGGQGDFFQSGQGDLGLAAGLSAMFVVLLLGLFLVGIVWHLALYFTIPLIIDRNLGVVEALTLSMRAAFSNLGGLILLIIIQFFVALLGLLALCIGIFVAIPVIYASNAFAYRQVFPIFEQNFQTTPPPPDVYGGSFGRQA